jgi:hypothetical protein
MAVCPRSLRVRYVAKLVARLGCVLRLALEEVRVAPVALRTIGRKLPGRPPERNRPDDRSKDHEGGPHKEEEGPHFTVVLTGPRDAEAQQDAKAPDDETAQPCASVAGWA